MDPTIEIKARLPIEELVGSYCQLQKKGRNFVCLCPFHNDTHPSLLVSPDKGIAYCFACQTGGDVFSFYQAIEGVDFRQALKDLAERAGVTIEVSSAPSVKKDEKERARECLEKVLNFYQKQLKESSSAQEYLKKRGVTSEQIEQFELGVAPDSFSDTYQYLLREGFSRNEILLAGLGIQKDLKEGKIYDRFRNRLMFPIHDNQGRIIGFGGRTLGEDDAKYINSSDGPLYHKSTVLYGLHHAKESMRETKRVVMVEGYFDVLACYRVGAKNVVAVSGTALTDQHVKVLKRTVDTVVLCLDQDRAGKDASERAFHLCAAENLQVHAVRIDQKDPDEAAAAAPDMLRKKLEEGGVPYLDLVLDDVSKEDVTSGEGKRAALQRLLPLLVSLQSSVERGHYLQKAAELLGTTEGALKEDLQRLPEHSVVITPDSEQADESQKRDRHSFSQVEVAIGLILLHPAHRELLSELIAPEDGLAAALYGAIKGAPETPKLTLDMLDLPEECREQASILQLFCEHHGFAEWSDTHAQREIRKNCLSANREIIRKKQQEIARKLLEARREGKAAEEAQLSTQYQQVLKLLKMAKS